MRGVVGSRRRTTLVGGLGILIAAAYAVPLFLPPATHSVPVRTLLDDALLVRLFPYLPPWWVSLRLLALATGAGLLVWAARVRPLRPLSAPLPAAEPSRRGHQVALAIAVLPLLSLPWLSVFPAWAQSAYLLVLWVPGLVLARTTPRLASGTGRWSAPLVGSCGLVAVWLAVRLWVSWSSPRAADVVDMWRTYEGMAKMWSEGGNFLAQSFGRELVGINASPYFMQGLPLLQLLGIPPQFAWVQVANGLWFAAAAVGVALLADRCIGRGAAVVATATYCFSPYILLGPLNPTPMFVGPVFAVLPPLLLLWHERRGSRAAPALFGPATGLAMSHPALAGLTGAWIVLALWMVLRRRPVSRVAIACGICGFLAALLPSLPGPATLGQMVDLYAQSRGQVPVLEETVLAQVSAEVGNRAGWEKSRQPPALDVPLAVALAPFVVSRTSIRLIGDAILDPLGAVLVAVGLLACLRAGGVALGLPLLLVASMGMAVVSSTDHPSLLRFYGAPIPLALLAGVGFVHVRASLGLRHRNWPVVVAGLIAVGGTILFDVVNPRLLRASAAGLTLRALAPADLPRALYLTNREESPFWRSEYLMMRALAATPIETAMAEATTVEVGPRNFTLDGRIVLWSPALEAQLDVTRRLCGAWADGSVYEIYDAARLSRLFGFTVAGNEWTPGLPQSQWRAQPCAALPLPFRSPIGSATAVPGDA